MAAVLTLPAKAMPQVLMLQPQNAETAESSSDFMVDRVVMNFALMETMRPR
jgi:hypothetical protein